MVSVKIPELLKHIFKLPNKNTAPVCGAVLFLDKIRCHSLSRQESYRFFTAS
jgi:hypothetical protein